MPAHSFFVQSHPNKMRSKPSVLQIAVKMRSSVCRPETGHGKEDLERIVELRYLKKCKQPKNRSYRHSVLATANDEGSCILQMTDVLLVPWLIAITKEGRGQASVALAGMNSLQRYGSVMAECSSVLGRHFCLA